MQDAEAQSVNAATRDMHLVVNQIGVARRNLQQSRQARVQLHTTWKTFLETSISRWHGYVEEFARQDQALQQDIIHAADSLRVARKNLQDSKEKTLSGPSEALEISDDENMVQEKTDSSQQILVDVKEVAQSLMTLKHKVDASWTVEEKAAKAVKIEQPESSAAKASAAVASFGQSMQLFGKPDS